MKIAETKKHNEVYDFFLLILAGIIYSILTASYGYSQKLSVSQDNSEGLGQEYADLSIESSKRGDERKALELIIQSIYYTKQSLGKKRLRDRVYQKGRLEVTTRHPKDAIESFSFALTLPEDDNEIGVGCIYNHLGVAYLDVGDQSNSLRCFLKSFQPDLACKESQSSYNNVGVIFLEKGMPDSALYYLDKVKPGFGNRDFKGIKHLNVAYAYLLKGQYNIAETYYDSAYVYLKSAEDRTALVSYYLDKSEFYERQKKFDKALLMLNEHVLLKDSIFSAEDEVSLSELKGELLEKESAYELQQTELEISKLKNQRQHTMIVLWVAIGSCLVLLSMLVFYRIRLKTKRIIQEKASALQSQEAEMLQMTVANEKLVNDLLQKEIQYKKKDLVELVFEFRRKQNIIGKTVERLEDYKATNEIKSRKLGNILDQLTMEYQADKKKNILSENLDLVNQEFFSKLSDIASTLSKNDLDLCSYFRIGLSAKEIAKIRFTEVASVRMARYRLRKKLGLEAEVDLYVFLQNV